jgi:hypothetical protein
LEGVRRGGAPHRRPLTAPRGNLLPPLEIYFSFTGKSPKMISVSPSMYFRQTLAFFAAFAICGNFPGVSMLQSSAFAAAPQGVSRPPSKSSSSDRLGDQSKIEIIRFVSGEFAKVVLSLPRGGEGFTYRVDKPLDTAKLHDMVRTHGAAVNNGDKVQITQLTLEAKRIVFEINGGGGRHFHLRDHLQVGMGGSTSPIGSNAHPGEGMGATLVLDYGRPLPEMTPDQLKQQLSPLLDFAGETSATVAWIDTVPPEFKKAIQAHQASVGMDEDMVTAALGRPEHKVRERDPDGNDTEDWIYGEPPAKTTFVTFTAGKVIRVKDFND